MFALHLDSGPCQVFLQLLASDLSFQKDKNYLSRGKALTMKYTAHAVGKPSVYFHRLQLVCAAGMIHSSPQQNRSVHRVSQTERILSPSRHCLRPASQPPGAGQPRAPHTGWRGRLLPDRSLFQGNIRLRF